MSAIPPRPDPGGTADRVRCAYCGGNNFPTSPTCWQCGRPLRPLSVNASAGTAPSPAAPAGPLPAGSLPPVSWSPSASPLTDVDSRLAPKAAAALGLMFPWAGLPIGIAFLMLDDARKAKLGWIAIGWSIGGTILNVLLFVIPLLGLLPYLKDFVPHNGGIPGGGGQPGGAGGGISIPSFGGAGIALPSLRSMLGSILPLPFGS